MEAQSIDELRRLLGAQVRHYRRERGWTQSELAEKAELSLDMIGRLERGSTSPSFDTLARLADVFRVAPALMIGGSPFDGDGHSEREIKLARIFALLAPADSSELDRAAEVLAAMLRR